jgi:hypothetical protein
MGPSTLQELAEPGDIVDKKKGVIYHFAASEPESRTRLTLALVNMVHALCTRLRNYEEEKKLDLKPAYVHSPSLSITQMFFVEQEAERVSTRA